MNIIVIVKIIKKINLINNSELYVRNIYDYLENVDPDVNLLDSDSLHKCNYYSQLEFNEKFNNTNDLSILHTNIKSSKKILNNFYGMLTI